MTLYWPFIPLGAGFIVLAGCVLYARSKRPVRGGPYQGSRVILLFVVLAIGLFIYSLVGFLILPPGG